MHQVQLTLSGLLAVSLWLSYLTLAARQNPPPFLTSLSHRGRLSPSHDWELRIFTCIHSPDSSPYGSRLVSPHYHWDFRVFVQEKRIPLLFTDEARRTALTNGVCRVSVTVSVILTEKITLHYQMESPTVMWT